MFFEQAPKLGALERSAVRRPLQIALKTTKKTVDGRDRDDPARADFLRSVPSHVTNFPVAVPGRRRRVLNE